MNNTIKCNPCEEKNDATLHPCKEKLRQYNNDYYHTTRKYKNRYIICDCGKKLKRRV